MRSVCLSVIESVCVQDAGLLRKESVYFTETWCCHWPASQSEELIDLW